MLAKHKVFPGGYRFKNFEGNPEERSIEIDIPGIVIIPLKQGFGNEISPIVKIGNSVKAGQVIGLANDIVSSPVHSSVNGTVENIKKINYFKEEINAVIIRSDGTKDWKGLEGHSAAWEQLPVEKLEELLYLSGVTSLGKQGIPTRFKTSIILAKDVEDIIIHSASSEVYNPSLSILLGEKQLPGFVEGLKILKKIMPHANLHLVWSKYEEKWIEQIIKLMPVCDWIHFYTVDSKYPQDYEEVLIPTILEKQFPYGYSAANMGVVVLDIQAVSHIYEAVVEGKPVIERTIALAGPGFKENPHIKVRVGTPLEHITSESIKKDEELRFILNSPLAGATLSDLSLPIDRTFISIVALLKEKGIQSLAFMRPGFKKDSYSRTFLSFVSKKGCEVNIRDEKRPFISCTFCEEVCHVGIIPHLLYRYV